MMGFLSKRVWTDEEARKISMESYVSFEIAQVFTYGRLILGLCPITVIACLLLFIGVSGK
jgi:hypothetical protein